MAFEPGSGAWRPERGLDQALLFTVLLSHVRRSLANARAEAARLSPLPSGDAGRAGGGAHPAPAAAQTAGSAVSTARRESRRRC